MNRDHKYTMPKGFVVILAMLTSITPLAIDVYLPSFIQMSEYFYTSIDQIEITLSIYLLGFALGQLIGGPLSDRFGRKIFIFSGLVVYIIFSFLISLSSSVEQLWVFRFFQALGGGFAVVNTSAIVRDIYHGREGAKVFSIISMIMMIAPMIAPVIGASILYFFSWSYIFVFLSLYGSLLLYLILQLPETSPKIKGKNLFSNYKILLTNKNAIFLMLAGAFGTSGMFIFIAKASFIYMEYFKVDTIYFAMLFSLNAIGLMIVTKINITLLEKYSSLKLLLSGVIIQLFIAVFMLLFSSIHIVQSVVIGFVLYISTLGFIFGNVMALLLEHFKSISATATALNGVVGFIMAAFVGFLASYFHDGSLIPVFMLMIATSLLSLGMLSLIFKRSHS